MDHTIGAARKYQRLLSCAQDISGRPPVLICLSRLGIWIVRQAQQLGRGAKTRGSPSNPGFASVDTGWKVEAPLFSLYLLEGNRSIPQTVLSTDRETHSVS